MSIQDFFAMIINWFERVIDGIKILLTPIV
jgi:hypothetical protein